LPAAPPVAEPPLPFIAPPAFPPPVVALPPPVPAVVDAPPLPLGISVPALPPPVPLLPELLVVSPGSLAASSFDDEPHAASIADKARISERMVAPFLWRSVPPTPEQVYSVFRLWLYTHPMAATQRQIRRARKWAKPPPPPLPAWHGLLAPVAANAFGELDISVALWISGDHWSPFHVVASVIQFEHQHGVGPARWAHDARSFAEVYRTRKLLLREHAGFYDLFVPVLDADSIPGVLVAGPFALSRPSSADILKRWHDLTGSLGRVSDPSFVDYVAATLSTLTLEGSAYDSFERLLRCFAGLVDDRVAPQKLFAQAQELRAELAELRLPDRMWATTRLLLDERTSRTWALRAGSDLHTMGMKQTPEHVLVGLLRGRDDEPDPVDDLIRRDSFQRKAAELAQEVGSIGACPVGDHGVAFVVDHKGPRVRARSALVDLAGGATRLAHSLGFGLHVGVSQADDSGATLPTRYRGALWAAEKALANRVAIAHGEPRRERSTEILRELRAEIGHSLAEHPSLLVPRFDRYVEAVLAHSGYRFERARAELYAGLERLTEPLLSAGFLDRKSHREMFAALEERSESARTVSELVAACRTLVLDIKNAVSNRTAAQQDRGTRRAIAFMKEHASEPLTVAQVAHVAGFGPDHFCRLFKRDEGITPERYLMRLRVERAKSMLSHTALNLESVGKLSGFQTRNYFHRVFKRAVGLTPTEFRERG
jgi:AraC-like DNA-binding protein